LATGDCHFWPPPTTFTRPPPYIFARPWTRRLLQWTSLRFTAATTPAGLPKATVFGNLTPTELQVLQQLAGGSTTKEIAAELVVAISTIDRHITHIYTKLGARNRAEATAIALKTGLVQTD
jgi:DNA-binding NarL/FixJ family response regulator